MLYPGFLSRLRAIIIERKDWVRIWHETPVGDWIPFVKMDAVVGNDLLLTQTFSWIIYDCNTSRQFCKYTSQDPESGWDSDSDSDSETSSRKPCLHAQCLATCNLVCRRWSLISTRILWRRYARDVQVISLINSTVHVGDVNFSLWEPIHATRSRLEFHRF